MIFSPTDGESIVKLSNKTTSDFGPTLVYLVITSLIRVNSYGNYGKVKLTDRTSNETDRISKYDETPLKINVSPKQNRKKLLFNFPLQLKSFLKRFFMPDVVVHNNEHKTDTLNTTIIRDTVNTPCK